jgi:hypothetical protein
MTFSKLKTHGFKVEMSRRETSKVDPDVLDRIDQNIATAIDGVDGGSYSPEKADVVVEHVVECPECSGTGFEDYVDPYSGERSISGKCRRCEGSGIDAICPTCDGRGKMRVGFMGVDGEVTDQGECPCIDCGGSGAKGGPREPELDVKALDEAEGAFDAV